MKILLLSLGCNKNLVDSEMILGALVKNGHEITLDEPEADYIIVNTCAFINDAKQEAIDNILDVAWLKENRGLKAIVVAGCMSERYKEEIKEALMTVRQQARDEAVSILTRTAESAASTEEARTDDSTGIQVMADNAVVESRIENLVIAKGYVDCVAFVNDNGVNVIVSKTENGLTDTDVAKIRDIVISEASVTADAIKIMENEAD